MNLQRNSIYSENLRCLINICLQNYINQILESLDIKQHVIIKFSFQLYMLSYMLAT